MVHVHSTVCARATFRVELPAIWTDCESSEVQYFSAIVVIDLVAPSYQNQKNLLS